MIAVEAAAAVVTVLAIVTFGLFLVSMSRLPSSGRPRTPVINRWGEKLPPEENPGYRETEDERH